MQKRMANLDKSTETSQQRKRGKLKEISNYFMDVFGLCKTGLRVGIKDFAVLKRYMKETTVVQFQRLLQVQGESREKNHSCLNIGDL